MHGQQNIKDFMNLCVHTYIMALQFYHLYYFLNLP
jgi:hypothetical protein